MSGLTFRSILATGRRELGDAKDPGGEGIFESGFTVGGATSAEDFINSIDIRPLHHLLFPRRAIATFRWVNRT